jgi:hypothetical protein|nr:MAG TPA: hypothetical protein [Caudoviricetes sp.]
MVKLLVVASCGTATYKTETYKNKEMFQNDIENVNEGYKKLITFTDKFGKFVAVSPVNCVIECEDCEE